VKRVRIPRAFIPLAAVIASLVHFLASMALLVLISPGLGGTLTLWLLALPLAVVLQTAGLAGLALLTSSLNVYYRDVEHVLALILRVGFYLTPTFYPLSFVPGSWRQLALLNPMTGIVEVYRALLVQGAAPPGDVLTAAVLWSMFSLGLGVVAFTRNEPDFDDHM
jgi:ABC-2 type transport system permease protein